MIILTRLGGGLPVAVNPDLIERAEPTPDTVITLIDGHKFVVVESVDQVIALILDWRANVGAAALRLSHLHSRQSMTDDEAVPLASSTGPSAGPSTGPSGGPSAGHAREPDGEAADAVAIHMARVLRLPRKD